MADYYVLGRQTVFLVNNVDTGLAAMRVVAQSEGVETNTLLPHDSNNNADMEALVLTMANGESWAAKGIGFDLIKG